MSPSEKPNQRPANIKNKKSTHAREAASVVRTKWSGPLPPPSVLEGYNHVLSNGAERVLEMAIKEQQHRHEMDKKTINSISIAHYLGTLLAICFIAASLVAMYFDHIPLAMILAGVPAYKLISAFASKR